MLGLGIVLLVVGSGLWLGGVLLAGLFKLTFGLLGGLIGFFAVGFAALLVVPIVLFALLPLWLPVLFVAGIVWLIVYASRNPPPTATQPAPSQSQVG